MTYSQVNPSEEELALQEEMTNLELEIPLYLMDALEREGSEPATILARYLSEMGHPEGDRYLQS